MLHQRRLLILALIGALLIPLDARRADAQEPTEFLVSGTVTDSNGDPVQGAAVRLLYLDELGQAAPVGMAAQYPRCAQTFSDGTYLLSAWPGEYQLVVETITDHRWFGDVGNRSSAEIINLEGNFTADVEVPVPGPAPATAGRTLRCPWCFILIYPQYTIVPGVQVTLTTNEGTFSTTSNELGRYFFDVAPTAESTITLVDPTGEYIQLPDQPDTGHGGNMIKRSALRVRIEDQSGNTHFGAAIDAVGPTGYGTLGRGYLDGLGAGEYLLRATKNDGTIIYWPDSPTPAGATPVVISPTDDIVDITFVVPTTNLAPQPIHCRELIVGSPGEALGSSAEAGAVTVLSTEIVPQFSGDLVINSSQLISQASRGVVSAAETGDRFGASVACGDFNGDLRGDLAVGSPGEAFGALAEAGIVHIVPGNQSGQFDTNASYALHQNSSGVPGAVEAGDKFGHSLAVGDFNGDHFDDLAIGAPGEGIGSLDNAGIVHVFYGSPQGLNGANSAVLRQGAGGWGKAEAGDEFGFALSATTIEDFDSLAVGVPGEGIGAKDDAGIVQVFAADHRGLAKQASRVWSQGSPEIYGVAEAGDRFGESVLFHDDHFYEWIGVVPLIVGAPGEDVGGAIDAGAVSWIDGTLVALDNNQPTYRSQTVWQGRKVPAGTNGSDMSGKAESGDRFGAALAPAGRGFVLVGAPGEDIGSTADAGAVHSLAVAGSLFRDPWTESLITMNTPGIPGEATEHAAFGGALTQHAPINTGPVLQVIAAPGLSGGQLFVVDNDGGISQGATVIDQSTPGVPGGDEPGDMFGAGLTGWGKGFGHGTF